MPRRLETRQAAAVGHQVALALHHVNGQSSLAILVGREVLCAGRGNGLVARDDALGQAAHGFHAQRQRDHVQQQQIAGSIVAGQLIGLNGSAQRHDFVGIEIGQRLAAEEIGHGLANLGHAGGAANHDHALHLIAAQVCILERAAHGRKALTG